PEASRLPSGLQAKEIAVCPGSPKISTAVPVSASQIFTEPSSPTWAVASHRPFGLQATEAPKPHRSPPSTEWSSSPFAASQIFNCPASRLLTCTVASRCPFGLQVADHAYLSLARGLMVRGSPALASHTRIVAPPPPVTSRNPSGLQANGFFPAPRKLKSSW